MNARMPIILSLAVVSFCLVMIASGRNEPTYWSTVTGILGCWLPLNQPNQDRRSPKVD